MSATWKKSSILHSPPWKNWGTKSAKDIKARKRARNERHLLSKRVALLPGPLVVFIERCLENRGVKLHLLSEGLGGIESLHKTTTNVVLAVPFDLFGSLAVEDESDGVLAVLPDAEARVSRKGGRSK
jgi:hypothetical protein